MEAGGVYQQQVPTYCRIKIIESVPRTLYATNISSIGCWGGGSVTEGV